MNIFNELTGLWRLFGCIAAFTLFLGASEARETYVQFAGRITAEPQEGRFRSDLESALVDMLNSYRRKNGFAAFGVAGRLRLAARAHAMDMAINDFVGHQSSTGQGFDSRMRALNHGAMFLPSMGENAARERSMGGVDRAKAGRLFAQWVKSGSHRRLMLSRSFNVVYIGAVQKGNHLYAVITFSGPEVKTNVRRAAIKTQGVY